MTKVLKIYVLSLFLGILTGTLGSLFQLAIAALDQRLVLLYQWLASHGWHQGLVSGLVSMCMVYLAWLSVRYLAPEAAGSGVPEIEGALLHVRPIFWKRLLPVKFVSGVLAISAKMVLGREGPTIQMGGNLGEMLGRYFSLSRLRRDALIGAGAAAGLATAFNAPLAGVLFVMEEMRNQFNFSFTNFKIVLICCVTATVMLHLIIGPAAAIPMAVFNLPSLPSLFLFFIFGIVVGLVGLLFNNFLMWILSVLDKLNPRYIPYYVLFVGFGVGYLAYLYPPMVGGGYEIISQTLTYSPGFSILVLLIVIRFLTSIVSYSTGVPGGIFAPMLALGTLLGLAAFQIVHFLHLDISVQAGMFAVAGMGALFAAIVRSPITGVVLVVEMTQNYSLILPLMVTCITSTTVVQLARNKPIYTQLLVRARKLGH